MRTHFRIFAPGDTQWIGLRSPNLSADEAGRASHSHSRCIPLTAFARARWLAASFALLLACAPALRAQSPPTLSPASAFVPVGGTVTLSVSNFGAGYTYTWYCNGTNLGGGSIITTVVGNLNDGFSGDGGPAANALLCTPDNVVFDASGNMFISDPGNSRIRKVDTNGIISTVAGNGTLAYSGDGGPATNASVWGPDGLAFDGSGSLLFADSDNCVIREVTANGIITTVMGVGTNGFSGAGGPASRASFSNLSQIVFGASGNLYIADSGNNVVWEVVASGIITRIAGSIYGPEGPGYYGDGGPATNAWLYSPGGLAVDASGNLFIADTGNSVIRKVDTHGIITTFAGNGTYGNSGNGGPATRANFSSPYGLAFNASGSLIVADLQANCVRKIDPNGIVTAFAGTGDWGYSGDGGPATNANMYGPDAVAVDAYGNVFIADEFNNVIRKVAPTNGPSLTLRNMKPADSGRYSLVISGPSGSVTSSVAVVTVVEPAPPANLVDQTYGAGTGSFELGNFDTNSASQTAPNPMAGQLGGLTGGWAMQNVPGTTITGWICTSDVTWNWNRWQDADGGRDVEIGANGDAAAIYTTVALTAGVSYKLSFALSSAPGYNPGIVQVTFGDLTQSFTNSSATAYTNMQWQTNTMTITPANSGNYAVQFYHPPSFSIPVIDAVSVQGPPVLEFPPKVSAAPPINSTIALNWNAPQSYPPLGYQVQYTTNLALPDWQNVGAIIVPTNGPVSVSAPASAPASYYRLLLVQ